MSNKDNNKEKKYYWLKLDRNFFKRHDIRIIEDMPNGKEYVLFFMKLLLESIDHIGELRFNDLIPYNAQMLSTITNTNIDVVRSAIKAFQELELLEIWDNQTIYISDTSKMLGEQKSTERVQRLRERQRLRIEDETLCNVTETLHETEKEKELEKELKEEKESNTLGNLNINDIEEENTQSGELTEIIDLIQHEFKRPLSSFESEKILYWYKKLGYKFIEHALREAVIYRKLDINYIDKVLARWVNEDITLEMLNKGEKHK